MGYKFKPNSSRNDYLQPALLFAAFADHLHICDCHVTMFGGILIHAMLFCFGLRIFFHAVHFRIRNQASNRNRMTDVIAELVAVALELPSAALRRGESVLVGVVAFLQAARERPCFIMGGACCVLRRCQAGCTGKQEQRKRCHRDHHFHVLPPKVEPEKWESRPSPPRIG
jgi:hypothetical protein